MAVVVSGVIPDLKEGRALVQNNLRSFHRFLAPNVEETDKVISMFSLMPLPFYNAVFTDDDATIKTCLMKLEIFKKRNIPFVWFAEEGSSIEKDLIANGGIAQGLFQGGAAPIDLEKLISTPIEGVTFTHVKTAQDVAKQVNLISGCLGLNAEQKSVRTKIALDQLGENSPLQHWIAVKEGKTVGLLGVFINKNCAMFINAITEEAYQNSGIMGALVQEVLKYALDKGCDTAVAYLNPALKAKGIGEAFGGKVYWRYTPIVFSCHT